MDCRSLKEISADADEGADDNDDESIVSPLRVGDTIMQGATDLKLYYG